jgi:hypothetical protein
MGILDDTQTCNGIDNEWELCTPELFESTDIAMFEIVNNPENHLPQFAPDGNYCPSENTLIGDVNGDLMVNILDVITSINLILNGEYALEADLNEDEVVNILDIVGLVNIILGE